MNRHGKGEDDVEETTEVSSVDGVGESTGTGEGNEKDGSGEGVTEVMDNLSGGESHEERKKMYTTE